MRARDPRRFTGLINSVLICDFGWDLERNCGAALRFGKGFGLVGLENLKRWSVAEIRGAGDNMAG